MFSSLLRAIGVWSRSFPSRAVLARGFDTCLTAPLLAALAVSAFAAGNATTAPSGGLLLEYKFEGDVADSSGRGRDGATIEDLTGLLLVEYRTITP